MNSAKRVPITLGDWYNNYALEIELPDNEMFLKVKETLTRMGVLSSKDKKLYQSCHILSKKDKYYIVHFKELFALDGRGVDISDEDLGRRNTIASLIEEWGLIEIVDHDMVADMLPITSIKVIKHSVKDEYELISKYQIGNIHKR